MGSIFSRKKSPRERNNNSGEQMGKFDARQDYGERETVSNQMQRVDYRVLRCFCGCTPLNYEQVERFAMMNVSALLVDPIGKPLFRNFLKIGHTTDKSSALLSLECFEMCDRILNSQQFSSIDVAELVELLPSFAWERRINDAIDSDIAFHRGQSKDLHDVLIELQTECVRAIECHNDFDRFRKELLRKIMR